MAKKKVEELTIEEKLNNSLIPLDKQPYKIPQNWCWVRLESLLSEIKSGTTAKQNKSKTGYNVTRIESLQNQTIDFNRLGSIINSEQLKENDFYIPDDIVLSNINSEIHVGKTALITKEMLPLVHGMNLLRLRFKSVVISKLFQYYSQSNIYKNEVHRKIQRFVNQVSINSKHINSLSFPLPPLAEQERIVNKLDNYISKLDEAKEKLEKVVDTYEFRKSVILHKAFTGELTKKWRKENNISFGNWNKNKLSDLCIINPPKNIQNVSENTIVSVIPMSCVSEDGYVIEYLTKEIKDVQKGLTNFIEGDVVFAKITPCMENGKSAIIGKLANDIGFGTTEFYVFRCNDKLYNKYLHYIFRDKVFRTNAKYYMRGSVGQQRLPKSYLENYILNLPPLEEQKEIVKILDSILSKEKQVKEIAEKEIERVEDLKKNLLTRAFGGVLGTNDPNEENSIELLKSVL